MKKLIDNLRKVNPNVDFNIFKSLDNVNLNCVLGTKKDGVYKSFLDDYNSYKRQRRKSHLSEPDDIYKGRLNNFLSNFDYSNTNLLCVLYLLQKLKKVPSRVHVGAWSYQ